MEWIKITDDIHPPIELNVAVFWKTDKGYKAKEIASLNSITQYKDSKSFDWRCKDWSSVEPTHFCYLPEDPE